MCFISIVGAFNYFRNGKYTSKNVKQVCIHILIFSYCTVNVVT